MKQLSKVHSDEKSLVGNCLSFRKLPEICSSLMGTYFKTQLKLTHFIKSMFQTHQIGASYLEICFMPEAMELICIRYELICVIE